MDSFRNILTQNIESVDASARKLVKHAVSNDSYLPDDRVDNLELYREVLPAGKDNATVAIQRVNSKRLIRG
jgi:hypothetical protein